MDETQIDRPRMTAEEADARFAALVAQHRQESQRRPSLPWSPASSTRAGSSTGVLMAVYALGALAGLLIHGKPVFVVLLGVPVVLLGRAALRRYAGNGDGNNDAT